MRITYTISEWCSHPYANNDDCNYRFTYFTYEEAFDAFSKDAKYYVQYIMLEGPGIKQIRYNSNYRSLKEDKNTLKREYAIQASMFFGLYI